jgi:hypothetical protein
MQLSLEDNQLNTLEDVIYIYLFLVSLIKKFNGAIFRK